jgi:hypothetical protein
MCGCEHHWDRNAPCTCTCPDHKAVREEMSRNAPMSATDHTLTDAERAMFERIEDTGDTQGLAWRVQELVAEARAFADEESASRVALANRLIAAEAEKEALRAERDAEAARADDLNREVVNCDRLDLRARTEAAEAALAGLVAAVEALAEASLRDGRGGAWVHDVWFRALLDADHAAALRAHEALAWDDAVTEGFDGGWLHDAARDDLLARNPYRADSTEQARP